MIVNDQRKIITPAVGCQFRNKVGKDYIETILQMLLGENRRFTILTSTHGSHYQMNIKGTTVTARTHNTQRSLDTDLKSVIENIKFPLDLGLLQNLRNRVQMADAYVFTNASDQEQIRTQLVVEIGNNNDKKDIKLAQLEQYMLYALRFQQKQILGLLQMADRMCILKYSVTGTVLNRQCSVDLKLKHLKDMITCFDFLRAELLAIPI